MNRIRSLRKQKKLSQLELAERLHISQTAVSQWETEKTSPDFESLLKLGDIFGCSIDYLLGRTDVSQTEKPATTEGDGFGSEAINLIDSLPEDKRAAAIDFLRYLAESGEKQ